MNENLISILIAAGVAGGLMLIYLAVRAVISRRREARARRLGVPDSETESILSEHLAPALPTASAKARQTLTGRIDLGFVRMIERSGLSWTPEQALAFICLIGVSVAGALYLWKGELWLMTLGLAVGIAAPLGVFAYLQARWRRLIQQQLPDTFFLMARSLRAGLNMEQAISLTGAEGLEPLAKEFRRCSEQINLGLSVPAALQLMANRLQLVDFNVFVSIVSLHRTTGGNLALLLDRLAASARDRNQYAGYFRSATALGRVTALAIGLAVPAIFLGYAIFEPSYASRFFESAAGIIALTTAFGLELIGIVWLMYLLRVDY